MDRCAGGAMAGGPSCLCQHRLAAAGGPATRLGRPGGQTPTAQLAAHVLLPNACRPPHVGAAGAARAAGTHRRWSAPAVPRNAALSHRPMAGPCMAPAVAAPLITTSLPRSSPGGSCPCSRTAPSACWMQLGTCRIGGGGRGADHPPRSPCIPRQCTLPPAVPGPRLPTQQPPLQRLPSQPPQTCGAAAGGSRRAARLPSSSNSGSGTAAPQEHPPLPTLRCRPPCAV